MCRSNASSDARKLPAILNLSPSIEPTRTFRPPDGVGRSEDWFQNHWAVLHAAAMVCSTHYVHSRSVSVTGSHRQPSIPASLWPGRLENCPPKASSRTDLEAAALTALLCGRACGSQFGGPPFFSSRASSDADATTCSRKIYSSHTRLASVKPSASPTPA